MVKKIVAKALPGQFYLASLMAAVVLWGLSFNAHAYDVEQGSTGNQVFILLMNENPSASFDSISLSSNALGMVNTAVASIVPSSVAIGGSALAAIDFDISSYAPVGSEDDLVITASGLAGGQPVDVVVTIPLTMVSSAASAQGFFGATVPSPDPGGVDTDSDGVSDALEISYGSNPNNAQWLPGLVVEENVPVLGIMGAIVLAALFLGAGSSAARRQKMSVLALAVVMLLPLNMLAGSATRIQVVASIPIPPPPPPPPAEPEFIEGATATASSSQNNEGAGPPYLAVDGNMSSRWGSLFTNNQWLTLDLGAVYSLSEVIIHWEAASAASYHVQGSNNNSSWTTLSTQTSSVQGNRTDTVDIEGSYRYVRMQGVTRTLIYGYSIFEMEVWGIPAADEDGDGVDDSVDQCSGTPAGTAVAANGCPDSDGDGVNDGIDQCPSTPFGTLVDATGCVVVDTDNDGVPDNTPDLCPNTPAGISVDATGCEVVVPVNEVTAINNILAGGSGSSQPGLTLYIWDNDPANTSACYGGCATSWPPLLVTDGVASGVPNLGTTTRSNGDVQATYNNQPLYYYAGDTATGDTNGDGLGGTWHVVAAESVIPLFDATTPLEPVSSYVRGDGVVVTRFGDRGRDRHAKDIGYYDPNNIQNSDHYDHYLAHYWEYRTARVQFEDHVPNGQSLIKATYITESRLGAKEFRVWFSGITTTGQFHWNPTASEVDSGTFDDNFQKVSSSGNQWKYTVDITTQWKNVATFNEPLQAGVNMEFEISQFLVNPPAGLRKNYYGTTFVYVIGSPGLAPFEWQRGQNNNYSVNDGTPIPAVGLLGGDTTLGYNYSEEPAGRFMQMATNLSHINAQPFVRGRRVHHTSFVDGSHDERYDNPIWTQQVGKAGTHYINTSCANCHVRNGRALVADVGQSLDKWVFKVGDINGDADANIGKVLQPNQTSGASEGSVTLGAWTESNGLRSPNYVFSNGTPARFSARIAPQLVGLGLLEAVPESQIMAWEDPNDTNGDGISGRAALVSDPVTGETRLGRFGYKAATSSVLHQSASALNTDIGVMTSLFPDPDCGANQTGCGPSGQELADDQLGDLAKYVSLLGVGARRDYSVTTGETLFNSVELNCQGCHRDTFTTSDYHPLNELRSQTIHPYTDMLLHDMGPGLADNLGEGVANGSEWRTAPLWGLGHTPYVLVGDLKANDSVSLPIDPSDINRVGYLHDGRARTIDEAIRWHGGEAESSKQAYEALSPGQQAAMIQFLESL
ncbi:discoidin domain-containing protein [Pseudomonadales bacterium]|nr:discoidin domain-containing protein [Pseudomonadales bacterium]